MLARECPAPRAIVTESTRKLIVVSGPSGVGKSTLIALVRDALGCDYSVSATTRPPRDGEVDHQDYHFVNRETFEKMIAEGELLEWAEVFGEYYGTPAGPIRKALAEGKTVLLDVDVQGAIQVHEKMPQATFVLIVPPSRADLEQRLTARGTESPQAVERRLRQAKEELRMARTSGIYGYTVVNDDLQNAADRLREIATQE